jgi:ADP-ribose pyrophosphatase
MENDKDWLKDFVSVYKGNIIEVLSKKTLNGKPREVARRSPGIRIIAITNENKFIFSSEHREYLERKTDIRLPGGKVVDTLVEYHELLGKGNLKDAVFEAAKRELQEETGITAQTWELFKVSTSGGTIGWDLYYLIAKDLTFGEQRPEDDEKIEVKQFSLSEAINATLSETVMSEDRSRMALLEYFLVEHPMEIISHIARTHAESS